MSRGLLNVAVVLLVSLLNGCTLNQGNNASEGGKPLGYPHWLKEEVSHTKPSVWAENTSYELQGLNPKLAAVISRDITDLLTSNILPAKNRLVFNPPAGAVLGSRLQQQLRQAGYGLVVRADKPALPLSYFLDLVSHNKNTSVRTLRLGVRLGAWRVERLYSLSNGHLRRMGTTTNLKIRKPDSAKRGKTLINQRTPQIQQGRAKRYSMPGNRRMRPVDQVKQAKAPKQPTRTATRRYAVQVLPGSGQSTLNYNLDLLKNAGLKGRIITLSKWGKPVLAEDGTPLQALQIGAWTKDQATKVLAELKGVYHSAHIQEVKP